MKKMKFREFVMASGTHIICGKDENTNDELMKKFKGKKNTIVHTSAPGSPFCVIKKHVFEGDVYAAGVICARYSQKWRGSKKDVVVDVFTGKDISKRKDMKPGSWNVKKSKKIKIKKEDIEKVHKK